MGEDQREALEIYFRIKGLAAAGGTDYSSALNTLLSDAKSLYGFAPNDRAAAEVWIEMQNAIAEGASFTTTKDALATASKQYVGIPSERRKDVLLFLKCSLNKLVKP